MDLAMAAGAGVPQMMRFRHRGHRAYGAEHTQSRDKLHTTKQYHLDLDRPVHRESQVQPPMDRSRQAA
jgi:hypothetical protein